MTKAKKKYITAHTQLKKLKILTELHTRTLTSDHVIVGQYNENTSLENFCTFQYKKHIQFLPRITYSLKLYSSSCLYHCQEILLQQITENNNFSKANVFVYNCTYTHTPIYRPFVQDYPGKPVTEGKTNLDFTEARDSERQWHQLDRMQVCTSLQTDNHASTPPLSSLQAGCPSCRPTNSVKALKAQRHYY